MIVFLIMFFLIIVFVLFIIYKNIKLKVNVQFLSESTKALQENNSLLEQEKINYIQKIERLTEKINYQEQIINEFKKLNEESKESTKAALFELGNQLSQQLLDLHKKENKETKDELEKNVQNTTKQFNSEFERIVGMVGSLNKEITQSKEIADLIKNSLLSPSGAGALAEITLENILKASGLRSNLDYYIQYNVLGESQDLLRPDSIVFLPDNKVMIIDAKASKFLVEEKEPKLLTKTMNQHLRSLSGKSYKEAVRNDILAKKSQIRHITTLMFLPTEHAVEKLLNADKEFMNKAWKHDIYPVGPIGLMNMLSFAKFQISEQMIVYNHQKIISEVQKLIASIGAMTEHSVKLGNSIYSAANYYDKFAASFNHNFLSKARNLSKMGIENGLKKDQTHLKRFQVITSNSELIEVDTETQKANKKLIK